MQHETEIRRCFAKGAYKAQIDFTFSPFSDDTSTTRDTAFAKIRARVEGTRLAAERLGSR